MEWGKKPAASCNRFPNFRSVNLFTYIRYFFFLSWNWDLRHSFFIIRHEIRGEKKYGIHTTGFDELEKVKEKGIDISHATFYMPVNYYLLEIMMSEAQKLPHNKTFLDIGCGSGRALVVASHYGFEKITGIDFSPQLCEEAKSNLIHVKEKLPTASFRVIQQDASYYEIPGDISVIFLFNPFDEVIMNRVIKNILDSQQKNSRTIWVIYVNPQHKDLFLEAGFSEIYHHRKLKFLQGCLLEKKFATEGY
jgi:SAM-dependent methyltransferase